MRQNFIEQEDLKSQEGDNCSNPVLPFQQQGKRRNGSKVASRNTYTGPILHAPLWRKRKTFQSIRARRLMRKPGLSSAVIH